MVRQLSPVDNLAIRNIIRTVMPEFGASGKGFAIHDPEVEEMYSAYTKDRCAYFVYEENDKILGGGGVGPLLGGDAHTCELKKCIFCPKAAEKDLGKPY